MIWFLSDLGRVARERAAIEELQGRPDAWLKNVTWKITPLLEADADIEVNGQLYPVTLKYPYVFPSCPPSVFPRGVDVRWSFHQYGRGGELCLEWGADNWHPDITGGAMLESAHRLLSLENPAAQADQDIAVPSRDAPTFAQQLSGTRRFAVTQALLAHLDDLPLHQPITASICAVGSTQCLSAVTKIELTEAPVWRDKQIPSRALDGLTYSGFVIRFPTDTPEFPRDVELADFERALGAHGINLASLRADSGTSLFLLLQITGKVPKLFWIHAESFSVFSTVHIDADSSSRLTEQYAGLAKKSICIVGCGSLGSKVAASLSRAGVGIFDLVDDDVFLYENLVRHDLDWRSMGEHKATALSRRLRLVQPQASVTVHQIRLNGQASSTRIASALRAAADCDLIIDATADSTVFNLLAAIAGNAGKAMVWAEVFGGGIGGMVARFLPGLTPTPSRMRAIINQWCTDQGVHWLGRERGYGSEVSGDTVMVADDADVSVIAGHAARYALDHLLARDPLEYRHAAYLVGLKRGWIFSEPFDTHPIDVGPPEVATPSAMALSDQETTDTTSFLATLISGMLSETPSSG